MSKSLQGRLMLVWKERCRGKLMKIKKEITYTKKGQSKEGQHCYCCFLLTTQHTHMHIWSLSKFFVVASVRGFGVKKQQFII